MSSCQQLVQYSSSDSHSSDEETSLDKDNKRDITDSDVSRPTKRLKRGSPLPLPESICRMFDEKCEEEEDQGTKDEDERHQGRKRSFAHVRGNWPTYVHIPVVFEDDVTTCLQSYKHTLTDLLPSVEGWPELHPFPNTELHISLSRTVPIMFHWIEPLTAALKDKLRETTRFTVSFEDLAVYSNDENTRSFIGLKVREGHHQLCKLVDIVDECFEKFRLPTFYEERSLHVSLFWCLGNLVPRLSGPLLTKLKAVWEDTLSHSNLSPILSLEATTVQFKTGNKLFSYSLS